MTIIWYMIPEISTATDRFFLSSWAFFCPFTPLTAQKIKISKKMRKALGDIIILHKCTKTHDHILSCSWDMPCSRYNYFSFWAIFCPPPPPPPPLTTQKMKISKKKWKKCLEISFFNTTVPKIMIICYTVPEIQHVTDAIVIFQFGIFFALSPH